MARLISIFLLSFLGGVAIRSFFNIPLELSWAVFGILLGFLAFEKITNSLHSRLRQGFGGQAFSTYHANVPSVALAKEGNSEKTVQRTSDLLSFPPLLTKERGLGGEVKTNYRFEKVNILALVGLLIFLGVIRLSYFEKNIENDSLHNFYGQEISIDGNILESRFTQASQRVVVRTIDGKILIVTKIFPEYKYGDVVKIYGRVQEPGKFGDIDMKKILAKDKIYSELVFPQIEKIGFAPESRVLDFLFRVRGKFEKNLASILPEPYFSLANGMLLGNEGVLGEDIKNAFQKSGTIHILVLSGYNITVVGAAIAHFFGFIPAVAGIILFVLMTGGAAPAVRAAIMGIIGLLIFYEGRPKTASLVLLWSAVFMVFWNPAVLRFDRGFQLSFLATLGLILLSGFFSKKLKFLPKFLSVRENASSTLSAQIFVLPMLLSWGNYVSFMSPVANILIVGAVPYVMSFSFFGGLAAFLSQGLGQAIASVAYILIDYQIYVAKIFSVF